MADGATATKRQSRAESKNITRKALLVAGLQELVEHGLDVPSLDAICARAGYTRGAFYVHFKDREDFLTAVTDWVLTGILNVLIGVDGEDDLDVTIGRYTSFIAKSDWPVVGSFPIAAHRVFEAISRSEKLRARFGEIAREATVRLGKLVRRAQETGQVRRDLEADKTASLLLSMGIGAMSLADSGVKLSEADLRDSIVAMLKP